MRNLFNHPMSRKTKRFYNPQPECKEKLEIFTLQGVDVKKCRNFEQDRGNMTRQDSRKSPNKCQRLVWHLRQFGGVPLGNLARFR